MVFAELWKKIRNRGTPPKFELPTTHNCLKKVLLLSQIVGVFPLNHLNEEPEKLHFTFKSWKVLYTSLTSFGYLFCASLSFYKAFKIGILLNQLIELPLCVKMRLIRKMKSDLVLTIEASDAVLAYPQPSFHQTFSFVVIFGQFFGIMPLHGVSRKNVQEIRLEWKSFRFVYAVYNIFGAFVMGLFCILKFALDGLMLDKTATMSFYVLNFFGSIQFIIISKHWVTIMKEWSFMEMSMRNYGSSINMKKRFVVMTSVIMTLALVEHLLFIANAFITSQSCENATLYSGDEMYFRVAFPSVFTLIDYSLWKACFVEIANILSTATWNYTDLFIILISCSLASRFAQINHRLKNNKLLHEKFWREIREDYNKLAHLTAVVDRNIAALVVISFVSNAFFICVQLYNSLKIRVGTVETVYYFFSFGFLVARTIAVTLYGAWINDESRKPLEILHSVPSEHYCEEISRFIQQINSSPVGITGSKFFILTRNFLLKMASTIVTFELMFLQFGPLINTNINHRSTDCFM
ncbi:Gustatory receptor for sugar taste 64f-like Protein [Tribolium castaneum]|uniref:Gustatory receptor for sugar taste 64f-like Protein n=2 Tax=Tribolium castaneum TaxID=7070 RepID=A0A139WIF2_TRICA|nr:Gustatory receptor for sugar taste 64f-like Protein [Tribolium castaneum]